MPFVQRIDVHECVGVIVFIQSEAGYLTSDNLEEYAFLNQVYLEHYCFFPDLPPADAAADRAGGQENQIFQMGYPLPEGYQAKTAVVMRSKRNRAANS